jgi:hypothetical protein
MLASCTGDGATDNPKKPIVFEHLASKTPYPFVSTTYTDAPAGFAAEFITHVGRHGSRHLSSAKYDITLKALLDTAANEGAITTVGEELRQEVAALIAVEDGNYGELSALGRQELQGIGSRAAESFTSLFTAKPSIIAQATYKSRAQDSRDNFITGLKSKVSSVSATTSAFAENEDPYLRPYDIAPLYLEHEDGGDWETAYKAYEEKALGTTNTRAVLLRLFSEDFYDRLEDGEFEFRDSQGRVKLDSPEDASSNLYNLYIISANLKAETDLNFKKYFTTDQLKWYESVLAIEDFYAKGPSLTTTDLPTHIIAPLVKDMINSVADSSATNAGLFRFAHAETMIPLASFLELEGAAVSCDNPEEVIDLWDIATISPMAANIQWIIYSDGENRLVKMLYNEVETAFPSALTPVEGMYYNWDEVKAYYQTKITDLGFSMTGTLDDDIAYLKAHF